MSSKPGVGEREDKLVDREVDSLRLDVLLSSKYDLTAAASAKGDERERPSLLSCHRPPVSPQTQYHLPASGLRAMHPVSHPPFSTWLLTSLETSPLGGPHCPGSLLMKESTIFYLLTFPLFLLSFIF